MNRKYVLLMAAALSAATIAHAENFPTSQFGYTGWYLPGGASCATEAPNATHAPTATAPAATQTPAPSTGVDYTTPSAQVQEEIMLNLLNSERIAQGLSPLTLDATLSDIARTKSNDMLTNRYFAHESPTYGRVSEMLTTFGYSFVSAGENIAHHANVDKAHAAFMSSDGHRRNILSSAWQKVGIGIVYDANGYVYVTQIFVR